MAGRKRVTSDVLKVPAMIDGVWVETVVVVIDKDGDYSAVRFGANSFVGKGAKEYLAEDMKFWKDKGYEIVITEERQNI